MFFISIWLFFFVCIMVAFYVLPSHSIQIREMSFHRCTTFAGGFFFATVFHVCNYTIKPLEKPQIQFVTTVKQLTIVLMIKPNIPTFRRSNKNKKNRKKKIQMLIFFLRDRCSRYDAWPEWTISFPLMSVMLFFSSHNLCASVKIGCKKKNDMQENGISRLAALNNKQDEYKWYVLLGNRVRQMKIR